MEEKRGKPLYISEEERKRLLHFLKTINSITEEELKKINDYYGRLSVIYKHNKLIAEIRRLSGELREKGYDDNKHKKILDNIHEIETKIFVRFRHFIEEEKQIDDLKGSIQKQQRLLREMNNVFNPLLRSLSDDLQKRKEITSKASKKIIDSIREIERTLHKDKRGIQINKYLLEQLEKHRIPVDRIRGILIEEKEKLDSYRFKEKYIDEIMKVKLRESENSLNNGTILLKQLMDQEKSEFIEPFRNLLNKKIDAENFVEERIKNLKKDKITIKDVKEDLRAFSTTPDEVLDYINFLKDHKELLEDNVTGFLNKARKMSKFIRKHREDILNPVTGLHNKKKFKEDIIKAMERSNRTHIPFSVALLDIDSFKKFNDLYSHTVGDEILRLIARLITETIRDTDSPYHVSGEEFVIIFGETDIENSKNVAEKIRRKIESDTIKFVRDDLNKRPETINITSKWRRSITVSIGLTTYTPSKKLYKKGAELLDEADEALKFIKETKKNRVLHYTELGKTGWIQYLRSRATRYKKVLDFAR